jgi:plastocyanin
MRRLILSMLVVFGVAVASPAYAAEAVSITTSGFQPAQVTIATGETVTWTNNDTVSRQIVADGGSFTSPQIAPGSTYSFRFTRAGTVAYHDQVKTAQRGSVVVRGSGSGARTVTIASSVRSTLLGGTVELSGNVAGGPRNGQQLVVVAKPYGRSETRTPVVTESDGTWSLRVRPQIRTEYQVEWGNTVSSTAPIVYVRPRVQLRVLNRMTGRLYVKVTALRSYRGKLVTLQRLSGNSWVKVKRVRLGVGSVARFSARLPRTARIRVLVPTAPGYLQGASGTVLVRR